MIPHGKGFFTINLSECEAGVPASILTSAQAAGLSYIFVKVADGANVAGTDASGVDLAAPVVQALHAAGIAVWGWHYVYGDNPSGEAAIAITRARALSLDGYVVYTGKEYQRPNMSVAAQTYMTALRAALKLPIALSAYRFSHYHPAFPWSAFLPSCDLYMPQVYWEQAHDAGVQLKESVRQCNSLPAARPVVPIGAVYTTTGWEPTADDMDDFLQTAKGLGLPAVFFFDWAACRTQLPLLWKKIGGFVWPSSMPDSLPALDTISTSKSFSTADMLPAPDFLPAVDSDSAPDSLPGPESAATTDTPLVTPLDAFSLQYLAALNSRDPVQASSLYDLAANQVWADQTRDTPISIQDGFAAFFTSLPAEVDFCLSDVRVQDDLLTIVWSAGLLNGETTVVLKDRKIIQEYTFIS